MHDSLGSFFVPKVIKYATLQKLRPKTNTQALALKKTLVLDLLEIGQEDLSCLIYTINFKCL